MYVSPNFPSKKAMKAAVAEGKTVTVFSPGYGGKTEGRVSVEGPHSPKPHTWYSTVMVKDGVVVKVIS